MKSNFGDLSVSFGGFATQDFMSDRDSLPLSAIPRLVTQNFSINPQLLSTSKYLL
jgi:hypothetical protein